MKDNTLCYSVGALLYTPANRTTIANSVIMEKFDLPYSLALCLEDTINDDFVEEAENRMIQSLHTIYQEKEKASFFIPHIFIRVRNPEQINRLYGTLGSANELLTGFIIPKFSLENADAYIQEIININAGSDKPVYMMPIFESASFIDLRTRYDILYRLKDKLDAIENYVLNIRVGGSDLCHIFGSRRRTDETIYDIRPVSDLLCDIVTVFGIDYIVSGPVWEYYDGENWESGLREELKKDRLCGFTGKTAIHPKQIAVINEAHKVSQEEYEDAKQLLAWDKTNPSFVSGSSSHSRMNEFKTHTNWARQILMKAEVYGIRR